MKQNKLFHLFFVQSNEKKMNINFLFKFTYFYGESTISFYFFARYSIYFTFCYFFYKMEKKYSEFYSEIATDKNDGTFDFDEILQFYENQNWKYSDEDKPTYESDSSKTFEVDEQEEQYIIDLKKRNVLQIQVQNDKYSDMARVITTKNSNLNKFIHQETFIYLKELERCKLLTEQEIKAIKIYQSSGHSFLSHFYLFRNYNKIRIKCLQFYVSPQFLKRIFFSRLAFSRKIVLIKSLQKLRQLAQKLKVTKRWNSNGFVND